METLAAVLLLGLLFALFGAMHLWAGDPPTGGCDGSGHCGDCKSTCRKSRDA